MHKKISLLILSVCLGLNTVSSVTFADENTNKTEESVVYSEQSNNTDNNIEYDMEAIRDENDNYKITYKYLKEYYSEYDCYLYKGQDFIPVFILKSSNLNSILNSKGESFVLEFNINEKSFDESPSVLSGLSKEFYDTYSNKIYRWVYYRSNLDSTMFSDSNEISFPFESKDLKIGDKVYLYATSNLKNEKIELVGEKTITEEDILEGMSCGQVTFNTKLDVSDRAFFLTTSKIDNVSNVENNKVENNNKVEDNQMVDNHEQAYHDGLMNDEEDNSNLTTIAISIGIAIMALGLGIVIGKKNQK